MVLEDRHVTENVKRIRFIHYHSIGSGAFGGRRSLGCFGIPDWMGEPCGGMEFLLKFCYFSCFNVVFCFHVAVHWNPS